MTSDKLLLASLVLVPMARCNRAHRRNMRQFVCTSSRVTDVGKVCVLPMCYVFLLKHICT